MKTLLSLPFRAIRLIVLGVLVSVCNVTAAEETGTLALQGLEGEVKENALSLLSLAGEPCDAPRWRVKRRFQNVDRQLGTALRAFGYYRPKVHKQLAWDKGCWSAQIEVDPGEVVRIQELSLVYHGGAAKDPEYEKARAETPLKRGDPLRHDRYEAFKQQLLNLASERGYFRAKFLEKRLEVDPDKRQARIRLVFDSGPRFRIGSLDTRVQAYDPAVLQRLIKLKVGQPYSAAAIQETYRSLADSGFFERVTVAPDIDHMDADSVPVRIELINRKRHAYHAGLGLSTDLGPTASASYENRRINRFGHQLQVDLALSPVRSSVGVDYRIPLYDARWERLNLQGGFVHEDTGDTQSDSLNIAGYLRGKRGVWDETLFLELQRENSFVDGDDINSVFLMPGISWERRRVDDLVRPRKGKHLKLEVRGAVSGILADASFLKVNGRAKFLRPLGKGIGIARLEFGTIQSTDFDKLPASLRFFAGGDQSVRGYEFESLSPRDSSGNLSGGAHLLVGSIEYEYPLSENWSVALFADAGNAFDSTDDGLKVGVGPGVRWYTPVGPVRLDLGIPQDDSADSFRIHFSFGASL